MLILVRHGRTETNAAGRLLGRADPPLDDVGVVQASRIAELLDEPYEVVSSPLRRTRATAAALGNPVIIDDRWIELDYGEWEGRPLGEISADTWADWMADPEFAPPGGESLVTLGRRVRRACSELVDRAADEDIVVVSHVSPIKAAVAWALGAPDEAAWHLFVKPASITRISTSSGRPVLQSFNATSHLDGPRSR